MQARRDLSSGWRTYEIVLKRDGGVLETPFFDQLIVGGALAAQPITKMRVVETLGWHVARRSLKDGLGRKLIVKKNDYVWLVKCKPSCWRLYCYVWEKGEKRFIIYAHAVCKKKDAEDPSDLAAAVNNIRS
jgi:hypothetical protein